MDYDFILSIFKIYLKYKIIILFLLSLYMDIIILGVVIYNIFNLSNNNKNKK